MLIGAKFDNVSNYVLEQLYVKPQGHHKQWKNITLMVQVFKLLSRSDLNCSKRGLRDTGRLVRRCLWLACVDNSAFPVLAKDCPRRLALIGFAGDTFLRKERGTFRDRSTVIVFSCAENEDNEGQIWRKENLPENGSWRSDFDLEALEIILLRQEG